MTYPEPAVEALPENDNGFRVVARCVHCRQYLTLGENYKGEPQLRHTSTFDIGCRIYRNATADRSVVEMGFDFKEAHDATGDA